MHRTVSCHTLKILQHTIQINATKLLSLTLVCRHHKYNKRTEIIKVCYIRLTTKHSDRYSTLYHLCIKVKRHQMYTNTNVKESFLKNYIFFQISFCLSKIESHPCFYVCLYESVSLEVNVRAKQHKNKSHT